MNIIKDYDDERHGLLADAVRPVDKKDTEDVVLSRNSVLAQMLEVGGANIMAHYIADDGAVTSEKISADVYAELCDPNGPNYARKGWLRIDYREVDGLGYLPVCVESKRYYYDGERIKRDNGTAEKVTFTIEVDKTKYDADKVTKYAIKLRSMDDVAALDISDRLVAKRASIQLFGDIGIKGPIPLGYIDADTYAGYAAFGFDGLKDGTTVTYEWEPTPCGWLVVRGSIITPIGGSHEYRNNGFIFDITI